VIFRFVWLVGLYVLCTWFAEAFIKGPAQVTIFWPAAGVAFTAVLRYGWRWAIIIPVAVVIAHGVFVPVPLGFLPFSVASNLLGALAGAHVARGSGSPQVSVASGFAMLRGAVVMVIVAALIGTVGLVITGMVPFSESLSAAIKWSMGDLLGILCVAPAMLLLTAPPSTHPDEPTAEDYAPRVEIVAWGLAMLMGYALVYLGGQQDSYYALGMSRCRWRCCCGARSAFRRC
jgi:integral membrane sensor domain MASE1